MLIHDKWNIHCLFDRESSWCCPDYQCWGQWTWSQQKSSIAFPVRQRWLGCLCSFISSLRAGVQPTLDPPSGETFLIGPMRQPRERRWFDRCVWYARYVGWRRESRLEQLVRLRHLCSDSPNSLLFSAWPPDWHFCSVSQETKSHLSASDLTSALLIPWRF